MALCLLDNGADVNVARDDNGMTPLYIASANDHKEMAVLLLERGAEVDKAANSKRNHKTPLHVAVYYNSKDVAKVLIDHKADINRAAPAMRNATPLFIAAHERCSEVAKLLIERGAAVNKPRDDGATPLHAAAETGDVDLVALLLRNGADVKAHYTHFGTARELALFLKNDAVLKVIDAHVLRCQLIDICCALQAAHWPVLVLLECVAWSAVTTSADESAALPFDVQWQIAKLVRERANALQTL